MSIAARILLLSGTLSLLIAPSAAAGKGVRLALDFVDGGGDVVSERATIWVSERRLRIEMRTPGRKQSAHTLIYRGDLDRFYSLDSRERAYIEVDRQLIAAWGFAMQAARREVDAQLQRLPSDQHKMAERLLGARESGESLASSPLLMVPSGQSDEVSGYGCRHLELRRAELKVGEACVVDWEKIGIGPKDLEVFRKLANFQRELMGARELTPLEIIPDQPLDILVQLDGFPMYYRKLRSGRQESAIRVTAAEPLASADGLFEVPNDYKLRAGFSFLAGEMAKPSAPARPAP